MLDRHNYVSYSYIGTKNRMIDEIDNKILTIIQKDARTSNAEIARTVGLAPSAVLERMRKLEDKGIIRGYHADIDPRKLDYRLTCFVAVQTSDCGVEPEFVEIPEVLEVHDVAGEDSYLLKVRAKDTEHLASLLREIKTIPSVLGTRTTVVLETFKETTTLPVAECAASDKKRKPGKKK